MLYYITHSTHILKLILYVDYLLWTFKLYYLLIFNVAFNYYLYFINFILMYIIINAILYHTLHPYTQVNLVCGLFTVDI